ncbi:glycosyltransferase family 77 protein [Acinetobacter qingfengensis]|uniref:Nucleotide-diphospho-sugar transferase domain-containing protein n=1 Tax=Acinetobacter qingfengensis TaxID=1262585 RepID=A0A1E7R1V6_9GAMM|nr:putative nucleotide-diphospho-sugar transferase [Acinetobacter qingfengensis]KAA8733192.1 glycosyltransferase family 77 protein [Acinetobacter qingfengensis]OEY93283.1 hypothetical protein BJI46_14240 [Acinetobacter qingfengensis]
MLTIFGFNTNDKLYRKHANILALSAKRFDIDVFFEEISKDDWQKIIAFKPTFIAKMRKKLTGKILFIDADAIILEDIRPYFDTITEDIAVHYINGNRLISATIFINDTENAKLLLAEWEKRQLQQPDRWDQIVLQEVLDEWESEGKIQLKKLPPNFTFIFDTSKNTYGNNIKPMIKHFQASRDMRWIEKYKLRKGIYKWLMKNSSLLRSTRKIIARHNAVNQCTKQLGIDVQFSLDDLI